MKVIDESDGLASGDLVIPVFFEDVESVFDVYVDPLDDDAINLTLSGDTINASTILNAEQAVDVGMALLRLGMDMSDQHSPTQPEEVSV